MGNLDSLNMLHNAIDSNQLLSQSKNKYIKDIIKELMEAFNHNYPEVDLTNFCERIAKVDVRKSNKYVVTEIVKYLPLDNAICINEKKLSEDKEGGLHAMTCALISMASAKDYYYGFDNTGKLRSLNTAMTLHMENAVLASADEPIEINGEVYYTKDEYTMLFGMDLFNILEFDFNERVDAYFNNKPEIIYNRINEFTNSQLVLNAVEKMSYAIAKNDFKMMQETYDSFKDREYDITRKQNIETLNEEMIKTK